MSKPQVWCCGVLMLGLVSGCGGSKGSNNVADISRAGGVRKKAVPQVAKPSKEIVELSNRIPVYCTPEVAMRAAGRQPDKVEWNGDDMTAWYNGDTATNEMLRLKYREGRLIGKQIVHQPEATPSEPAQPADGAQP